MTKLAMTFFLLGALASPGAARTWPDCLKQGPKKTPASSFKRLQSCQKKAKRRLIDQAEAKGRPLSAAELDALDAHQRAEARTFLAQPRVVVSGPAPSEDDPQEEGQARAGGDDAGGGRRVGGGHKGKHDRMFPAAAAQVEARFREAGIAEVPSDAVERLKLALTTSGGKITPDIDRQINVEIEAALQRPRGNDSSPGDDAP